MKALFCNISIALHLFDALFRFDSVHILCGACSIIFRFSVVFVV